MVKIRKKNKQKYLKSPNYINCQIQNTHIKIPTVTQKLDT